MKITPKATATVLTNAASISLGGVILDTVIKAENKDEQIQQLQTANMADQAKKDKLQEKVRSKVETIKKDKKEIAEKKVTNQNLVKKIKSLAKQNARLKAFILDKITSREYNHPGNEELE